MSSDHYTIKVAIVEDNHFIRMALGQIIDEAEGYMLCGSYMNGEEAVEKILANVPDIVLMDINMGEMNGVEAVKRIRQLDARIQFLMCTVYEDDNKIFDALSAGANGYILKKTKPAELLAAIHDLYHGGAPMSSQIASKVVASFRGKELSKGGDCDVLSPRESEILQELVKGRLYKEIADQMHISYETVKKHVFHIYKKLHVNNRVEAFNKFYGNGVKENN